jgi:Rrf2 family transcriptional regulator, iron-sulfur cluster assembly transcription factor
MLSKACEYGIKALIFIAKKSAEGQRTNLTEIADGIESPKAFTAKVLQILAKNNLILSTKGATGGFEIEVEKTKSIRMIDVVAAIDGYENIHRCLLGLHECSGVNPCPVHRKYEPVRNKMLEVLSDTTIYDLTLKLNAGAYLKL